MQEYDYTLQGVPNSDDLNAGLKALALTSATYQSVNTILNDPAVQTFWSGPLSPTDKAKLDNFMASYVPAPNGAVRKLIDIYNDLAALTTAKQTEVWNDVSGGTPKKYFLDAGNNEAAIATLDIVLPALTGTTLTSARLRLASMYVQDNPLYLWHPAFDTSIAISGRLP